jgi:hypothetical protein
VNNVNTTIVHNVYNYKVVNITNVKVSYVGGPGGLNVRPTPSELAVMREPRIAPLPAQVQHMQQAAASRAQFAAVNNGRPATFAAARPLATAYRAPAPHPSEVPGARSLPPANLSHAAAPPRTVVPPNGRPAERPVSNERPETRAIPVPNAPARSGSKPELAPRPEAHPAPQPRTEQKPAAEPRVQQRTAAQPQIKQRPAPEPKVEQRPAPQPKAEQRPAPKPAAQQRPAPKQTPKTQPKKDEEHEPRQ